MSTPSDLEKGRDVHHEYDSTVATAPPTQFRKFANPGPLGLSAFALTTFVLSLVNIQARHVTVPNIVLGLALFYGGMVQFAAGMWEFVAGNTFGATAFSSYGGFWLSYGVILIPQFGIANAYGNNTQELNTAIGFYLFGWFIFSCLMSIATLRLSVVFMFIFFVLDFAFLFLAIGTYTGNATCTRAGGWFGLIAAFGAWYAAIAQILNDSTSCFTLPLTFLQKKGL